MNTRIIVNLQYEGIHFWKDCDIPEVSYLKDPHRHIFHICCKKTVILLNRQIEIICFKNKILAYLEGKYYGNFRGISCEMIANDILNEFELDYCSVLEDGENGAEVYK